MSHANSYQRFFVGNQPSLAFRDLTQSVGGREGRLTCQSPSLRQNSVFFLRTPVWNPETQINRVDRSKMGQLNKSWGMYVDYQGTSGVRLWSRIVTVLAGTSSSSFTFIYQVDIRNLNYSELQ